MTDPLTDAYTRERARTRQQQKRAATNHAYAEGYKRPKQSEGYQVKR